jgi:hypothetical protein
MVRPDGGACLGHGRPSHDPQPTCQLPPGPAPLPQTFPQMRPTSLLSESSDVNQAPEAGPSVECLENASGRGFYSIMLRDPRVLSGLLNSLTTSAVVAGFDTTLPLHVRNAFGWESLPAGMMFLCLQIPAILLGPVAGSIRDRHGVRSITFPVGLF